MEDNEMVIKYKFMNGEKVEIEVSNDLSNTTQQIESEIKNSDRRETRRHQSLSELMDKAEILTDKNVNIEEEFLKRVEVDKLYEAISKLKPSEQEIIHKLYLDKHPMTQAEYAKILGITENAVKQRVKWLRNKLKKLLSTHT